ncbi:MAG: MATE family efflux transporter [Propionibacteriaceae bacterium]|nr:MATE family efflux transporter [Propionibacteriaceae bacterium]
MSLNRRILALAVPAFAALVAQPLFVLADTAIVGRLGTDPLAGLSVGATISSTLVGTCIFLAYGSTAVVARFQGAGKQTEAMSAGVQAIWLALLLGVGLAAAGWLLAPRLVSWLGAAGAPHDYAITYLRWSLPGMPGILATLAATGTLRGLADGRTPMLLAIAAAILNLAGDVGLVFGAGKGIAGSGAATALAELLMGAVGCRLVLREATRLGARRRPSWGGMRGSLIIGFPLLIRTLALRAALVLTTWVAAQFGAVALAAHQVAFTLWSFLQYVLDALAIAGQTLIGQALGASRPDEARMLTRRMVGWSVTVALALGVGIFAVRSPMVTLFSPDQAVQQASSEALVVIAASLVLAAWVTLFDGVLIGAGDGRYLAKASLVTLAAYAPLALLVARFAPVGSAGLVWLWLAFGVGFMGVRAITLWRRERTDAWLVLGGS